MKNHLNKMTTLTFTILTSLFLAFDSGKFYASQYQGVELLGYVLSGLSYAAFAMIAYEFTKTKGSRRIGIGLILTAFIIINTISATMGAAGELLTEWERSSAMVKNSDKINGLKDLASEFNASKQGLNAAKMGNLYRDMVVQSVEEYKPLAWVKIVLILLIRVLLEFSILILAGNRGGRINTRPEPSNTVAETVRKPVADKRWQPQLKGVFLGREKLEKVIADIEEKNRLGEGFKFGNGQYKGEKAEELLIEAKKLMQEILAKENTK